MEIITKRKPKRILDNFFDRFGKNQTEADLSFVNFYNSKLEKVLNDEKLFDDFETILDEQKAVLMARGMSDREAETFITDFDNLREIVLSV